MRRNVQNLRALAAFIRKAQYEFDMGSCIAEPSCGTAGCIGAHASVLWPDISTASDGAVTRTWNHTDLRAKLGIDKAQEDALCYPDHFGAKPFNESNKIKRYDGRRGINRNMAVKTLYRFARTGKIVFYEHERVS